MISILQKSSRGLLLLFFATIFGTSVWGLENIPVGTTTRTMIAYAPAGLTPKRPLMISMHGMNQDAAYQKGQAQWELVADTANFVVVYPNGINNGWDISGNRDIEFVNVIIDSMANRYDIDRNRVYLSGFSMGGMFTYHAATRMADKIAAFGPVSGFPLGGGSYTSSRPVPIIHVHGEADDVVQITNLQGYLNGWISRNNCPSTAVVTKPYPSNMPNSAATKKYWGPGDMGVEVVLMTIAGKGHWHSMDAASIVTSNEIWNFCKKFALDLSEPIVSFSKPLGTTQHVLMGADAEAGLNQLDFEVNAMDPNGNIVKVSFYNGTELLHETTTAPYTFQWVNVPAGIHTLRAVATDDEDKTGTASVEVRVEMPQTTHSFSSTFTSGGIVPSGWTVYDGSEKRIGAQSGLSSGCRVLQFTGSPRDFNYGLYVRNATGEPKAGSAVLSGAESATQIVLYPAVYSLALKCANWNMASFGPVTCAVSDVESDSVLSSLTFTPNVNIGNSMANAFSGVQENTLWFEVKDTVRISVAVYTQDGAWSDFILGSMSITKQGQDALSLARAGYATQFGRAQSLFVSAADPIYAGAVYNALGVLVSEYTGWTSESAAAYEEATLRLEAGVEAMLAHKAAIDALETEVVVFSDRFNSNVGALPAGWVSFDGTTKRVGPMTGLGQGSRVLAFTAEERDFDSGLYIRNIDGRASEGYAIFGSVESDTNLILTSGKYRMSYRVCNWNMSSFGPITGRLLDRSTRNVLVEKTVTPGCNIGNNPGNAFSGSSLIEWSFELAADTPVELQYYTADAGWADAIISEISLRKVVYTDVQRVVNERDVLLSERYYDLNGVALNGLKQGLNVCKRVYQSGKVEVVKILMK